MVERVGRCVCWVCWGLMGRRCDCCCCLHRRRIVYLEYVYWLVLRRGIGRVVCRCGEDKVGEV
jgi:hypothetical protein